MAKKKVVAEELKAPAVKGLLRDVPDPTVHLNGVLRFDDDHIIRVKYDPDSKAMVIDDVPQSLESSITLGEGGGGGYLNPLVTVSIASTSVVPYNNTFPNTVINDNIVYDGYPFEVPAGGSTTAVVMALNDGENYVIDIADILSDPKCTFSNAVNCSVDSIHDLIIVTDPTLAASVTLTVTDVE